MASWNPNSTSTKGLETLFHTESSVTLDAATKSACMSIVQSASQAIGTARVYLGALPTRNGLYVLEVYDNETAVATTVATLTARPNEDVSGTGLFGVGWVEDDASTTTNIYDQIDEAVYDAADYIYTASLTAYRSRMDTAALTLTSQRILAVRLVLVGVGHAFGSGWVSAAGLNISGTDYPGINTSGAYAGGGVAKSATWYYNPATKQPWTIADVQAFDSTDEWYIDASSQTGAIFRLDQAYLEVVVCDENRLALGTLDDSASALTANAWNAVTLLTPTGGAWTKEASGRHLYLLRRFSAAGAIVVPTLLAATEPTPARMFTPTLDATYGYATAMGSATNSVYGLIQRTTAPAESVDSQPYVDLVAALVFTGQDAEQELSDAAVLNYKTVRFLAQTNSATAGLSVKIKRRSDNTQFGSTVTLTKAEVDALPDTGSGWREVTATLATAATLATGTQYYVEFSSTVAGTGTNYWSIVALDTGNQGNGAGYGTTTDRAVVNGTEADRYDLPMQVQSVPTAPTNFTTTTLNQTL